MAQILKSHKIWYVSGMSWNNCLHKVHVYKRKINGDGF